MKKHIYIIQMHTGTFPGEVIKLLTRYQYSHVVISLDKDCKTTYSFGRKNVNNFLDSGFVEEQQDGEFFQKFCRTRCRIFETEVTDEQYALLQHMINRRKIHNNVFKYDFAGIVLRFLNVPISFENRSVCSQFVAEILERCNIVKFEKPCCFVKPKDFDNRNEFQTIYEGLYLNYAVS